MYPDRLHNWINFGHGLLILFALADFWRSEKDQIYGFRIFWRMHGSNGLKFTMQMYPDHFQNCLG